MRAVLIAAALLAVAVPRGARADCGIPVWMGSRTDRPVPLEGSLYMYVGNGRGDFGMLPALGFSGGVGNAEAFRISPTVVRLDYSGTPGSRLTVKTAWDDAWVYQLDATWRAPATAPRVLQFWHHVYEWTCSRADSLMVQTEQETAAYRVTWVPAHGAKRELVMPALTDVDRSALELGKIDCSTESLPVDELAAGGHLELTAIRADRSEVAVVGLPYLISTAKLALDPDGLQHAFLIPDPPPAAPAMKAPDTGDTTLAVVVLLMFAGALGLVLHQLFTSAAGRSSDRA
jgi:hypothetical protein